MVRLMPSQARELLDLITQLAPSADQIPTPIAETLRKVREQIDNPTYDVDLVDTITSLLLDYPGAGSVLGGTRLMLLKDAVLSPSDLAKVNASQVNFCCGACGKDLQQGEMVGVYGKIIACHRCAVPELVGCKCGKVHDVSNLSRLLAKTFKGCAGCETNTIEPAVEGGTYGTFMLPNRDVRVAPAPPTLATLAATLQQQAVRYQVTTAEPLDDPRVIRTRNRGVEGRMQTTARQYWDEVRVGQGADTPNDRLTAVNDRRNNTRPPDDRPDGPF